MCILQIGELCKAVSDEMRTEETAVPWKEWCGIRDIFAHQYSNLDIQSAWDTIQNDVLKLQSKAENFKMEVKNRKNCFYSKDDDGLRIDFQFDTEKVKKEKLYDESANVEYEGTLVTDCFVKEIEEIIDKKEFVSVNRIFEIGEKYTMRQIAGNDEPNYIRECGKAWDKLWDYFDVAEYKDICFPETKKWFLTYVIMENIFELVSVLSVTEKDIQDAFRQKWKDFEDCVQYMAGKNSGADYIITVNGRDDADVSLPVRTPADWIVENDR